MPAPGLERLLALTKQRDGGRPGAKENPGIFLDKNHTLCYYI
jgi:hypothetical protein